jgi:hypothetical protein
MSDTVLKLGEFEFSRFEIPEVIAFGGDQQIVVHKMVGGTRIIDAMGEDPLALEWSGYLVGSTALDRALFLDGLRRAGNELALTWSRLSYTVVVKTLRCEFVRSYRIPYKITCEVVRDETAPIRALVDPSPEQVVSDDLDTANGLAGSIGDATLSGLMGGLDSAIAAVGNLATAAQSVLDTVLLPIEAVRSRVGVLLASTSATIENVSTLGGILPGNRLTTQVANLTGQIAAVSQQPILVSLDRTLGRMANNIAAINGGTKTITVGGGNLFALAATEYGDPMGWTALAVANRLDDPELAGIATLSVPPFTNDTGGVLNG